jgi:secreted PhoX family phosphatase
MRDHHGDSRANRPANRPLSDMISAQVSRRGFLAGGLGAAAVGFLAGTSGSLLAPGRAGALSGALRAGSRLAAPPTGGLLGFSSVPTGFADTVVVPDGYVAEVLIPWGTPILSGGPVWKKDGTNTWGEQAQQVGMHHDGMHYFPMGRGPEASRRGLLVVNHEYIDMVLLYSKTELESPTLTEAMVKKALAAHGVTVIAIALVNGTWQPVDAPYNRRITGETPMAFSGPVSASHPKLSTGVPTTAPLGTLNNCAHGYTPWGTYLTCEENWNGYFGSASAFTPTPDEAAYGLSKDGFGYRWHQGMARFDLNAYRNEPNRFGYVVEINPWDPSSTPVKRTALGRFKHEGATCVESRGRIVVYSGDDEDKEYLYKFVGNASWRSLIARGMSPLDHGTLYVAKFHDDGSGEWRPLVHGEGPLTPANGFADQADVILKTRTAADLQGATPLDRPEWVTVHPRTGDVFVTLTNGTADIVPPNGGAVNARKPNPYGHIVRIMETRRDHTETSFRWDIFALAGDPLYANNPALAGTYGGPVSPNVDESNMFSSPDGIWIDPTGRMWIQTDISNSAQRRAARGHDRIGNNAMLAADPQTGEIRRFLTGPNGCEITGVITTPDQRTMFVNVQHPGEETAFFGAGLPNKDNFTAVSSWPEHDPQGRARSATLVIRKIDGGPVGT